jgi:hypothetical protein
MGLYDTENFWGQSETLVLFLSKIKLKVHFIKKLNWLTLCSWASFWIFWACINQFWIQIKNQKLRLKIEHGTFGFCIFNIT